MSSTICLGGLSNSGKSTSLKYLDPTSTFIISCTNKQLQIKGFRNKYKKAEIKDKKLIGNWLVSNNYNTIMQTLKAISLMREDIKTVVIDDANYLMSNETMTNALVKGYDKFSVSAKNYYDLIQSAQNLRDDLTVVIISHITNKGTDNEPEWRLYTTGKLLDNTVNIDGLFSYIIYAERYIDENDKVQYRFRTRTNGYDTCRSTEGCFTEKYIEPNMKKVIDQINKFESEEE